MRKKPVATYNYLLLDLYVSLCLSPSLPPLNRSDQNSLFNQQPVRWPFCIVAFRPPSIYASRFESDSLNPLLISPYEVLNFTKWTSYPHNIQMNNPFNSLKLMSLCNALVNSYFPINYEN